MFRLNRVLSLGNLALLGVLLSTMWLPCAIAQSPVPQYPNFPSETPGKLDQPTTAFDFDRREVMIPMRDGVKLFTEILVPRSVTKSQPAPMLLTRTPYNAKDLTTHAQSSHLGTTINGYDNEVSVMVEGGYIRVVQDIRGKYGSEGDYVMNRPLHGPQNPTPVDHSTDTYDTIDWLVKNVPESNGRVGILGISYDGFTSLMGLVNPHPALKATVPMNPMVDGWRGDDWFHNGAFREINMSYIWDQQATRSNDAKWWYSYHDAYDEFLSSGSAGELGRRHGEEQLGFWQKILAHPAYDAFWQDQAVDKILARQTLTVPTMLVHSLWDQEDSYGASAVWNAVHPQDSAGNLHLVIGPWHHGQERTAASSLGAIQFGSDTGDYFQRHIMLPFLDHYLKDKPYSSPFPAVWAYETGTNRWEQLDTWPAGCKSGCAPKATPLYLGASSHLGWTAPSSKAEADQTTDYTSDPAKPVPYRHRPVPAYGNDSCQQWACWLVDDQREASGRTDVATFTSTVLTQPLKISGQPIANLIASTSGTDSDWVVKLIDVYPDEVAEDAGMGGYQLAVAMEIFRGRYRESLENAKALASNEPLLYKFALPLSNHVFLPGHRIMVQVQSSWFPLYDRNPQTFVPNIFWAKPGDYRKATQRVYHAPDKASFIELPVVTEP